MDCRLIFLNACLRPLSRKISNGSVGNLLPGVVARVLKQDGSWGRAGENGELIVTGPSMALGYVNNEQALVPPLSLQFI